LPPAGCKEILYFFQTRPRNRVFRFRHQSTGRAQGLDPSVTFNGVDVPFWASWIAVIVAGTLSLIGFRATMRG
jgi:hypothetical protein